MCYFGFPACRFNHRTVLTGTEKPEACQLLVGAPDIPVDKGQSGVQASRCRTGLVDIVGSKSFIEEVYVPEPECIAFPKEIGPVVFAVVPYGLFPGVFIVGQCTDCRGCSGRIVVFVPSSCLGEGLDAYRIIVPKACEEGYLYLQAFFHGSPSEGIFLSCLDVRQSHTGVFEHGVEKPFYPSFRPSGTAIYRLQGNYSLIVAADSQIVLVYGVASQHTEYGYGNLPFPGLCRHICVFAAGVISSLPVSSPEGVSVGSYLVSTIAGSLDMVFVVHICQCMGVYKP